MRTDNTRQEHEAGWTELRIESLKKLWTDWLSASQIAAQLGGGVTRNAVIGKVTRLGLDKRITTSSRAAKATGGKRRDVVQSAPKAARVPQRSKAQANADSRVRTSVLRREDAPPRPPTFDLPEEPEVGVDVTHLLGITQLTDQTCRFPIGDPLKPGFGFCGDHTKEDSVYCPKHHRRAYVRV